MTDWAIEETVRGFFWRPDERAEDACPGSLVLASDGGATLELFGWERPPDPVEQVPPVIPPEFGPLFFPLPSHRRVLGAVEGFDKVTLDRCIAIGSGRTPGVGLSRGSYKVDTIVQGKHYAPDEEVSLRNLGFYATGLEQMLHRVGVQEVTLHDGCRIRFVPDSEIATAHVEILRDAPTNLSHFSRHALSVRDFLTLARMRETAVYAMWNAERERAASGSGELKFIHIRTNLPRNKPSINREFTVPDAMLFSNDDVKDNFAHFIEQWFLLAESHRDALYLYFANASTPNALIDTKVLTLTRAIDAWVRVDDHIEEGQWTPSIHDAITWLIDRNVPDAAASFSTIADRATVQTVRNTLTHPGKLTSIAELDMLTLVSMERQLAVLLQICMLTKMGFSKEQIKKILCKDYMQQMLDAQFIKFV